MASRAEPARLVLLAVAFMVGAAVALRGYVPDAPRPDRARSTESPLSTILVVGLLVLAVAVVAVAAVLRPRRAAGGRVTVADRPDWRRGDVVRPSWRTVLVASAAVAATVCAAVLLNGLVGGTAPSSPVPAPSATDSDSAPSGSNDAPAPPTPRSEPPHDDLMGYLAGATALCLLVVTIGSVVAVRRRSEPAPDAPADAAPDSASERGARTLVRVAEVGLAEVADHGRDPRAAIIACYLAMERELARVPETTPEECDTASEVLARAVDRRVLGPGSATQLVDLFEEARFSSHVMSEVHRDVAAGVLRRVLDELRART